MKTAVMLLIVSLILVSIGCGGGSRSVTGTWELIFPVSNDDPAATRNIKIVSDTHFAFGSPAAGGGIFAGGGTYALSDSTYTEFIQYHTMQFLVGSRMEFRCIIEDDKWYHSGSFNIGGQRFTVEEVWQRIGE